MWRRCNACQRVGIAFLTPTGEVGFGLTTVVPGGTPIHTEATIAISTVSGTWRDSAGNNGTFIFTPGAGTGGGPRPVPSGGLAAGSVTSVHLAANSVGGSHVLNGSLTGDDLAAGIITSAHLAANSVGGGQVVDGSLTNDDLRDEPRASYQGGDQAVALDGNPVTYRIAVFSAPAAGRVIVNASGFFGFVNAGTVEHAYCTVSINSAAHNFANSVNALEQTPDAMFFVPFAISRGFDVAAGVHTFRLICTEVAGSAALYDSGLTVIYVANP